MNAERRDDGWVEREFARFGPHGEIEIAIVPDGLPRLTTVFPCPQGTETERQSRIADVRRSAYFDGYYIVEERRIRNTAFDERGEKTTTKFVVRPCRTKDEAEAVGAWIAAKLREPGR